MSAGSIEAIERLLAESADADEVLRRTVEALVAEPAIAWAGLAFVEGDTMTLGPAAGTADESRRTRVPVAFQAAVVGELRVDGDVDRASLEHVASLIAPHVLIGWDTGGEGWEP
ncbi:MAG TPA: hypothetical protein VFU84_00600 [Gaiellaceae bacterium]|nr:hypothetical protein [Gaiellaceae bacterium]